MRVSRPSLRKKIPIQPSEANFQTPRAIEFQRDWIVRVIIRVDLGLITSPSVQPKIPKHQPKRFGPRFQKDPIGFLVGVKHL